MYEEYNPNPTGRKTGDCAVRAVAAALGEDWETAFAAMALMAFAMGDMPSGNNVWGAVLRLNGFNRREMPDTCPDCYTFADFARDNPKGIYVLATGSHVATVIDGVLMDAWDSSDEVPQYYWYKRRKD